MTIVVAPRRFSVDDYHRMAAAGILTEDDRVELIEGEIVEMAPIGNHHQYVVDLLNEQFTTVARELGFVTRIQGSVKLNERSEPQPDVALLRRYEWAYRDAPALSRDVFLIVEVADSCLPYDQGVKVPLYSQHGIPETWIVNLTSGSIEVYRNPSPEGYETQLSFHSGDHLSPAAFPSLVLAIDEVFGRQHK